MLLIVAACYQYYMTCEAAVAQYEASLSKLGFKRGYNNPKYLAYKVLGGVAVLFTLKIGYLDLGGLQSTGCPEQAYPFYEAS